MGNYSAKAAYAIEEASKKSGKTEIKDSMKKNFGDSTKAKFDYKTTSVLKQYLCCRMMRDRSTLRKYKTTRSDFYFY
jgi:hypothetical protein